MIDDVVLVTELFRRAMIAGRVDSRHIFGNSFVELPR
jgi:hypothetical protein